MTTVGTALDMRLHDSRRDHRPALLRAIRRWNYDDLVGRAVPPALADIPRSGTRRASLGCGQVAPPAPPPGYAPVLRYARAQASKKRYSLNSAWTTWSSGACFSENPSFSQSRSTLLLSGRISATSLVSFSLAPDDEQPGKQFLAEAAALVWSLISTATSPFGGCHGSCSCGPLQDFRLAGLGVAALRDESHFAIVSR